MVSKRKKNRINNSFSSTNLLNIVGISGEELGVVFIAERILEDAFEFDKEIEEVYEDR